MRRRRSFSGANVLAITLLVAAALATAVVRAEIYKWIDDQGNVHFGDKPLDKNLADKAEQVELTESYQPTVRTAEEQEAYEREQQAIERRREVYRQEDAEARQQAAAQAKAEKAELCDKLAENIRKLTSMETVDGRRAYYYVGDEDGKSVTSEQQREIVEELRQQYAEADCS